MPLIVWTDQELLAGSSANLGTLTSSASHPDLANALLSESPERSGSLPHSQQSFNHLAGGGNLTPAQVCFLRHIFLLKKKKALSLASEGES